MKKYLLGAFATILLMLCLTGCSLSDGSVAGIFYVYIATALLSLLLLVGCILFVKRTRAWFILLFSSVLVVNVGYTVLSVSQTLQTALNANRIAYLGSVFLPFAMLMIILEVTGVAYKKMLPWSLMLVSVVVFLIAASPGILDIYYKEVSLQFVNGVSTLVKVYGPLHFLYLVYLLGYFISMVAVILYAYIRKKLENATHAIILVIAVFVNICVWLIEQLVKINFEMLSVSYIISELFLVGLHFAMQENQRLRNIVKQVETVQNHTVNSNFNEAEIQPTIETVEISSESIELFMNGLGQLTPTENAIFDAYISRLTTKEIMAKLKIKENTLKYHNKNLYGKLGVSSRKQLFEIYKRINSVKFDANEK